MHTAPDHRGSKRGKGLTWVLAALGALLVAAAVVLPTVAHPRSDGPPPRHELPVLAPAPAHPPALSATAGSGPLAAPRSSASSRSSAAAPVTRAAAAGRPTRLDVPALGVSTVVLPITLDGGVLEPPSDPQLVGWWEAGAVPGAARGTALITGHTVHTGGGVFDDLARLRRGDVVRVTTSRGVIGYRVGSVTVYSKGSLGAHAAALFSQQVPGRLALVTCADWNGHSYDSNTVVLASAVGGGPARR